MINSLNVLNGKVLIVDDKEADVQLLEQTLRGAGYKAITSTTDPTEVRELHLKNQYDLILLDLMMPGMDGFRVLEGLKECETGGYLPVLAVTAEEGHKLRALKSGAKDFVGKPFDLAEVLMRVHNMLEVRLLNNLSRAQARSLEVLALKDPLTGLANRRLLDERLSTALLHARRTKSPTAVLYLDLDGFKGINDRLGHGVGDRLLKLVADRLVGTVREEDTVARIGGDEFVIVLWNVAPIDATKLASKVIAAVSEPYVIDEQKVRITTSAGIGLYPLHGMDGDTLIKSADLALYAAKSAGKNVYRISDVADRSLEASTQSDRPGIAVPLPDTSY